MRVHRVRIVRADRPLRSQDEAASLEAMLALVRLLARQAAREVFEQAVAESGRSVEESRE
jgi:hypothetical protein